MSIKSELSSPLSSVSPIEVPDMDTTVLPSVIVQPVPAKVVGVTMAASVVGSNGIVQMADSDTNNVRVVLNSKVKIRPKPISIFATSSSLPTSRTGCAFVM